MQYIPSEFAIGGVYFPPLLTAGILVAGPSHFLATFAHCRLRSLGRIGSDFPRAPKI
jgi:hypothetical protein